jgi:hypothetical protein
VGKEGVCETAGEREKRVEDIKAAIRRHAIEEGWCVEDTVRDQLKTLAAERGRSLSDMVAEAVNLLFAKYHRPEIMPASALAKDPGEKSARAKKR